MPDACCTHPDGAMALQALAGRVRSRPLSVFDLLDARFMPSPESTTRNVADRRAFFVIAEAATSNRRESRVGPEPDGGHIEHLMFDLAPARRLGRAKLRRLAVQAPSHFDRFLRQLRRELE